MGNIIVLWALLLWFLLLTAGIAILFGAYEPLLGCIMAILMLGIPLTVVFALA